MSTHTAATVALVLACLALATAVVTLALTLRLMRQSGRTRSTLRRHRLAHEAAYGQPDPQPPDHRPRRGAIRYQAVTGYRPTLRDTDPPTVPAPQINWWPGCGTTADPALDPDPDTQRPRPEKSTPR
jgi:HAMP domain-containing protein